MKINFSEEDISISRGITELQALAIADIRGAHGQPAKRPPVSSRTLELYPKIIFAVEIDRDVTSN